MVRVGRKKSILLLLAIIAGAALITVVLSRLPAQRRNKLAAACSTGLKVLDFAKETWATISHKTPNDPPPTLDDLSSLTGRLPECPCGGVYTPGRIDEPAKCSLSPGEHTYLRQAEREKRSSMRP